MLTSIKPAWLRDHEGLQEIARYNLFMPPEVSNLTSLQDTSSFIRGMKQFLYWKGQLIPSLKVNTIFLAFLGPNGLSAPNVLNISKALKSICDFSLLIETYMGANSNFVAFSFQNKEAVQQIVSKFIYFEDSVVLSITQESITEHRFRLLWLPPLFEISRVHHLLNRFTKSHRLKRESISVGDGAYSPTNIVSGTLTLEPGGDVKSLPHLIQLPSPHKGCALLIIESRPPLCLKCRSIGHTRGKCTMIKCISCLKVHFPDASCGISSYSSVAAKNITKCTEDDWLSRLADENALSDNSPSSLALDPLSVGGEPNISTQVTSPVVPTKVSLSDINAIQDQALSVKKCDRTSVILSSVDSLTSQDSPSSSSSSLCPTSTASLVTPNKKRTKLKNALSYSESGYSASTLPSANTLSMATSTPIANYTRSKVSSKVRLTAHDDLSVLTARSHLIPYSASQDSPTSVSQKVPSMVTVPPAGVLFGDPDPDHYFSTDSDSSDEHSMTLDHSDVLALESLSRKRKGSSSSLEANINISPVHVSPSPVLGSHDSVTPDIVDFNDPVPFSDESSHSITQLGLSSSKPDFFDSIASLFDIHQDQVSLLMDLCPNRVFSPDIFKVLKLLSLHGIGFEQIIAFPLVLKMRLAEVKRKVKYLETHLGVFSMEDIWKQSKIETRIDTGVSINPIGIFHDG